jgi:DNA (cytosine-5)-methyltransferase 1
MGFHNPRQVPPGALPPPNPHETFLIPVSDTQAYKQFGNSVVVPVIRHLATELVSQLRAGNSLASAS